MTEAAATTTFALTSPIEQVFPRLTPAQMERFAAHGRTRRVQAGEVLLQTGESHRMFVVKAGSLETVRTVGDAEEMIVILRAGAFTGEMAVLSGRRGLARTRAREDGEVIEVVEGTGVYYGATPMEASLGKGEEVVVVGGGNSAGQAAVFLAESVRRVYMLVRGDGLAETMSRYLIRRIEQSPLIELRTRTEVVALEGSASGLEAVQWRDNRTMEVERHNLGHVFVMTGAEPVTRWLDGCVVRDDKGFIKTGPDLSREDLAAARWPLPRGRTSWRRACPACSPWATCAAATRSAWRRRWGRDRRPSLSYTSS